MSDKETKCFVRIDGDIVSCVHQQPNITSITKGYLIRVKRKFLCVSTLYNFIVKELSNYGGTSNKTYIMCMDINILDKINDDLNSPEYVATHSVEERSNILRTALTILCHADNSYIVVVDKKNKKLLNKGATQGLYTKITQPTFDKGISMYKLNDTRFKRKFWWIIVVVILLLFVLLLISANNGNRTQLKNITNNGNMQIQQITNNPVDIKLDVP